MPTGSTHACEWSELQEQLVHALYGLAELTARPRWVSGTAPSDDDPGAAAQALRRLRCAAAVSGPESIEALRLALVEAEAVLADLSRL